MLSTSNSISQMEDIHIMNHAKKLAAALLALCLMTVCALGALAEEPLNDLLGFYERATGQEAGAAEAPADGEYGSDNGEEELVAPEELIQVDDLAINESLSDEWENILLLGTDSRTGRSYTLTDTMIILSLNPATKQVKLTSLMRDLWVEIPGWGNQKLNAACVYAADRPPDQRVFRHEYPVLRAGGHAVPGGHRGQRGRHSPGRVRGRGQRHQPAV